MPVCVSSKNKAILTFLEFEIISINNIVIIIVYN